MYYKLTTRETKVIMRDALNDHYGFAPHLKDITILLNDGEGRYLIAEINGIRYRYIRGKITKIDEE